MDAHRFGPYVLEELLGQGGMGQVHRAVDTRKDRTVALKRLPRDLASNADFQRRFRYEAQVAARLSDPHVIPIHDYGEIDGQLYLDMRLVEGEDLAGRLRRCGPMAPSRAVEVVGQIATALDSAHRAGLVHRDVKPSNVLLTGTDDFVYLIDFGIARAVARVTSTGDAVGTIAYMAPERFSGASVSDHRADIYALGCVLYETLSGAHPFAGHDGPRLMFAHLHDPVPPVRLWDPQLAWAFHAVVARAMAKNPAERHRTAVDLAIEAQAVLARPPGAPVPAPVAVTGPVRPLPVTPPSRRGRTAAAVSAVVALLAAAGIAAGVVVARSDTTDGPPVAAGPSPVVVGSVPVRAAQDVTLGPDGRSAYVTGPGVKGVDTVSVVDTAQGTVAALPVVDGAGVTAISPDGRRAYVLGAGDAGSVAVLDIPGRRVISRFPVGRYPRDVIVRPDGRVAYVAVIGGIAVVDTARNAIVSRIPIADPTRLAVTPDGSTLYATGEISGAVTVIDTATDRIVRTINGIAQASDIAISPDGERLYVTQTRYVLPTAVVELATGGITFTPPVPQSAVTLSPDGSRAYFSGESSLAVLDTERNTVLHTVPVRGGWGMALSPDGARAYLTGNNQPQLTTVDLRAG